MSTEKSTNCNAGIARLNFTMRAVSISDAIKILKFVGETLGVDYDVIDELKTGENESTLVIGGSSEDSDEE